MLNLTHLLKVFLDKSKNVISLILIAVMLLTAIDNTFTANAANGTIGGSGSAGNPFIIEDAKDLTTAANNIKNGINTDSYYLLNADIDLTEVSNWFPIGTELNAFKGYFDGNGHTVSGLKINNSLIYMGLFGVNEGTIRNLRLDSADITAGNAAGGIAGKSTGTIENCIVDLSISGEDYIAGITGFNTGTVINCKVIGTVSGNHYVGGIVGNSEGLVENCTNSAEISGRYNAGGICGKSTSIIRNCLNEAAGTVSATDTTTGYGYAGGIVGQASGEITRCTNKADVSGKGFCCGGIAGIAVASIFECVNEGTVTSNGSEYTGGIAGENINGEITNCTNRGDVSGGIHTGGMAGYAKDANAENCLNSGKVTGGDYTGGIIGHLDENSSIYDCTNTGDVTGGKYTGGMTGIQDYSGDVYNCVNKGKIIGNNYTGGITGRAVYDFSNSTGSSKINYCTNTGEVNGSSYTGGIAGFSNANLRNSINKGNVTGFNYVGGIAGENLDGGQTLKNDVNEGNISGNERVGGITGRIRSSTIIKCLNNGSVQGKYNTGGIVGYVDIVDNSSSAVTQCINNGDVTGTLEQQDFQNIGGIVGSGKGVAISQCANNGNITSNGNAVGGVAGNLEKDSSIADSFDRGVVYGYDYIGGLVGYIRSNVSIVRCYIYAPDDNGTVSGKDGIDCILVSTVEHSVKCGAIAGGRKNTDLVLSMEDNYWWYDCSDYAIGWIYSFGINSGDGYKDLFYQKYFKDSSNFKNWDFTNVWVIKDGAPALRGTQDIKAAGGIGGVGGSGGTGGTGEAVISNRYISSVNQLKAFRDEVNNGNTFEGFYIYLSCDLDLAGENWTPIGTDTHPFSGYFEGQNHTIKGLSVNTSEYGGLFGFVKFGTVQEVCVYGNVTSSGHYVGGIAGWAYGSIRNCCFFGDVTGTKNEGSVGGICGSFGNYEGWGEIVNCSHVGKVTSSASNTGGVLGYKSSQNYSVKSCFHFGCENSVTGTKGNVGAIIGSGNQFQRIAHCFANTGSAENLFGNYNSSGGSPSDCAFLSGEEFINPERFTSGWNSNWDIDFEAGHVWGIGWEYPRLQAFSEYITLVPSNFKDDARIVWLSKAEMALPLNTYTRDGYKFDSWNTEADGSGTAYADGATVPANAILYAQWTQVVYTIDYDLNGGTGLTQQTYTIETAETLQKLIREHFTFDGWRVTDASGNWNLNELLAGGELLTGRFGNIKLKGEWIPLPKYTITWKDDNGNIIDQTQVEEGSLPTHADANKTPTAENSYTFTGWTPSVEAVTGDATYTATFSSVKNSYTITWKNEDGSVIDTTTVEYGKVPTHDDATKQNTAEFTYTFTGWTPSVVAVTGDATYTATFSSVKNSYTITWKKDDGSVIDTTTVEYGKVPTHDDATKQNTAEFTYNFTGWTPSVVAVTGEATYTATFNSVKNSYTITWKNDYGSVIDTTTVEYGKVPTHDDATKQNTAEFTYTFTGWTPSVEAVTGDATYTATFSSVKNSYTITWKNEDGTVIDTTTVEFGEVPTHDDATKQNTAEFTYTFTGWTPSVVAVTGDATYTAAFSSVKNSYTITWKNDDGAVIDTITVEYGKVPTHDDATKQNTAEFTYNFTGWTPSVVAVTGDATYTATFSSVKNSYTITWKNEDGSVMDTTTVEYGKTPTHADIAKEPTAEFTYVFKGWTPDLTPVSGDITYTAVFETVINEYTVKFVDRDGNELYSAKFPYGSLPTYSGEEPYMAPDSLAIYKFNGWDPEISAVTGDAVYIANFSATANEYTVTGGNGSVWKKGSEEKIVVTVKQVGEIDRSFDDFRSVLVDGKAIEAGSDFTATKGSTVITLLPSYLEKLNAGKHSLTVRFEHGEAEAEFSVAEKDAEKDPEVKPQKNQSNPAIIIIVSAAVVAVAVAITAIIIFNKKKAK